MGIVLLAGALTLLALGIVQSDQWGWVSARTVGALVGGLLVLATFVRRTLSAPHPALDLMIFARPSVRWANIATAAFTIGFTAMFFGLIQFMLVVWNYGVVRAGLAMVPGPVVVMVLAPRVRPGGGSLRAARPAVARRARVRRGRCAPADPAG